MQLHEIMDPRIGTVSANDYAAEALHLMMSRNLSWCFVLDRNEVTGMVWAKDLARLSDALLKERDVREYVTTHLPTVSIETELKEAERLLRRSGQHLLGIIKNNLPVGILSQETINRERLTQNTMASSGKHQLAC